MSDRIALVIGNSNYRFVGKLNNPQNDANDIESVLHKLGFDVTKVIDAGLSDFHSKTSQFLADLDDYAVGLLFYAGHGMQIDGKNYLVPVDLKMSDKSKTIVSCFCFNTFLESASSYKGKTLICILDACRNNPFTTGRGFSTSFAPLANQPKGTIVAYSTSEDHSASDGKGSNGLYTQVLKDALLIPNIKIEEMFKSVRNQVSKISSEEYGEEQISGEYSSLVGDFYFSVTPQPVTSEVADEELFEYIESRRRYYETNSDDIYDIESMPYVDAYNEYRIPVIKILRAYSRLYYSNNNYHFSDETIDQINSKYIKSWGFYQKYDRWYYKNHYVEMGDLLPLPDELKPLDPISGEELEIDISVCPEYCEGKLRFSLSSNIPHGTPLIFTVKGNKYTAQSKVLSDNGCIVSDWFTDKGLPIRNGFYTMELTCPINHVLPIEIQMIFGERSRNLCGKYVVYDPISGNRIHYLCGVHIQNHGVQIIDMGQRISQLI